MSMHMAPTDARTGGRASSYEHGKGSEYANRTGKSEAANQYGEMKRQTSGLLICIRSCVA
jgi:hypothetical protein